MLSVAPPGGRRSVTPLRRTRLRRTDVSDADPAHATRRTGGGGKLRHNTNPLPAVRTPKPPILILLLLLLACNGSVQEGERGLPVPEGVSAGGIPSALWHDATAPPRPPHGRVDEQRGTRRRRWGWPRRPPVRQRGQLLRSRRARAQPGLPELRPRPALRGTERAGHRPRARPRHQSPGLRRRR